MDELAVECGVARATIRQALDLLASEQLIERFRAKGTFVRKRPDVQLWCEVATDWSGLVMPRENAVIRILSDQRGLQPPASSIRSDPWRRPTGGIRRLHSRNDTPYYLGDLYIDERICGKFTRRDLQSKTALQLIADIPGMKIKDARQTLVITTADVETATHLDIQLNAPVVIVYRSVVDRDGCLVFVGDGMYRGDTFRIDMKLR